MQVVHEHPLVLLLRDHDTVAELSERLQSARRVVLVGNGGIATELAYSLRGVEVPTPGRPLDLQARKGEGGINFSKTPPPHPPTSPPLRESWLALDL